MHSVLPHAMRGALRRKMLRISILLYRHLAESGELKSFIKQVIVDLAVHKLRTCQTILYMHYYACCGKPPIYFSSDKTYVLEKAFVPSILV